MRVHWRHERLSVAMALADALHHSAQPRAKPETPPDREAEFYALSESSVVLGGCRPPPLQEARPQGSIASHGVNTETLVLDVPMLRVIDEDPPVDHDLFLAILEPRAEQKSRERRAARMRRRKRKKTEEEEASQSCLRSRTSL